MLKARDTGHESEITSSKKKQKKTTQFNLG